MLAKKHLVIILSILLVYIMLYNHWLLLKTCPLQPGRLPGVDVPQSTYCSEGWLILIPHEDKVDVISPTNILFWGGGKFRSLIVSHEDKVYVVSPFSILVIGGGGFRSLMMIRWYCFLMKITVFKVSFTCHRGLIVPLALLGFATSQQHKIVSVMSQWWVWANVKVADNMSYYMDVSENGI